MSNAAPDVFQDTGDDERSLAIVHAPTPATIAGPRLGLPTMQELETLKAYGQVVIESGMAPKHIDKWESAVVVMRYGHQLGVDEFTALQNMYVLDGKPTINASLMHSLILRDHGADAIHIIESTDKLCELRCTRRGSRFSTNIEYTIEEAQAAGLTNKAGPRGGPGVWKAYAKDMLFARAISRAGRQVFRDSTQGLYTPEEMDGNVIEVDGEVIDLDQQQRHVHIRELRQEHEAEQTQAAIQDEAKATKAQLQQILELGQTLGMTEAQVAQHVGKPGKDLSAHEAETIRKGLAEQIEIRIAADQQAKETAPEPAGAGRR